MNPLATPPKKMPVAPVRAEEMLVQGMAFLRTQLEAVDREPNGFVMPLVVSTGVGVAMGAAVFSKKLGLLAKTGAGLGAAASAAFATGCVMLSHATKRTSADIAPVRAFLDSIDRDPALRAELLSALAEAKMDTGPDGKMHYNLIMAGNKILDFGRAKGAIAPNNSLDALKLFVMATGDDRAVGPRTSL